MRRLSVSSAQLSRASSRASSSGGSVRSGGSRLPLISALPSVASVLAAHRAHWRQFRQDELSASWTAIARLVSRHPAELHALRRETAALEPLVSHTREAAHRFEAQPVAIAAHSVATLERRCSWRANAALWQALAARGEECADHFAPQGLTNTAWAFAAAGHEAPQLLEAIAAAAVRRIGAFAPRDLVLTAEAYAKAGHAAPALFEAIERAALGEGAGADADEGAPAAAALGSLRRFLPRDLSGLAWAFAKADHAAPRLFDRLAAERVGRAGAFTHPQDLSDTVWAFAKAGHAAPLLFDRLADEAVGRLGEFTPRALTLVASAYGRAGHAAPALLDAIAAQVVWRLRAFEPRDLTDLAAAYVQSARAAPELLEAASVAQLLDAIAAAAAARAADFTPQDLARTARALAAAGHAAPGLCEAISAAALGRVQGLDLPELTCLSLAVEATGRPAPALSEAIGAAAVARLARQPGRAPELARLALAASRAGHAPPALLEAIASRAVGRAGALSTRELSSLAYAYAKAGWRAPWYRRPTRAEAAAAAGTDEAWAWAAAGDEGLARAQARAQARLLAKAELQPAELSLLDEVAEQAARRAADFHPVGLASVAWAYAKAELEAPHLFDAIAAAAVARAGAFEPHGLASLAYAYAKARHAAPALLEAIAEQAVGRVGDFTPRQLGQLAWAFAAQRHAAPALLEAIAGEAAGRVGAFGPRELANTMWAFAVADVRHAPLLGACAARARELEAELGAEELRQLHPAQLWLEHEWRRPELLLPPPLRERCREAMAAAARTTAALHLEVGRVLASLYIPCEAGLELGGYHLDFALRERRVAVEVDWAPHLMRPGAHAHAHARARAAGALTGARHLKRRQLLALGWTVVGVPYHEWPDRVHDGEAAQGEYLARLLDAAGGGDADAAPPHADADREAADVARLAHLLLHRRDDAELAGDAQCAANGALAARLAAARIGGETTVAALRERAPSAGVGAEELQLEDEWLHSPFRDEREARDG